LLKQAMKKYLPDSIWARHKQPYRAPDVPSFVDQKSGKPLPYVAELLSEQKLKEFGYFDASRVTLLMKKALRGGTIGYKDNQSLVGILTTQLWHHLFIENFASFKQVSTTKKISAI